MNLPIVELAVELPVTLYVSWGDRERSAAELKLYTNPYYQAEAAHGWSVSVSRARGVVVRRHGYVTSETPPAWCADGPLLDALETVIAAAQRAEDTRHEVAEACAAYRAILDSIDREHEAHYRQWERDVALIARAFRRQRVSVGEQTVPGKCCVRSTRGKLLGYANVWDGRWLGTVERIAA